MENHYLRAYQGAMDRDPNGAEAKFAGVVDLVTMKAIYWHDETMGAEYSVEEIPADLLDKATHGSFRERTLYLVRCRPLVDELNQLLGHDATGPQLRTLEQAYADLASGKLR